MRFSHIVRTAIEALRRKKSRTALTMLGIIIGIASVIVIMAVGASAQGLILSQVKSIGSNLITVFPGASDENGPPASALGVTVTTLTYDDIKALTEAKNAPHVTATAPTVRGVVPAIWRDRDSSVNIVGTSDTYPLVEESTVEHGRFFSREEAEGLGRVAVLGSESAQNIFGDNDPVGQKLRLKKVSFTVIGVMKKRGTSGFQNQDDQIFIPISTAQKILLAINHVSLARVKVDEERYIDETKEDIRATLRERHDLDPGEPDDFSIRDQRQALTALLNITDALKLFLAAIASISLIVGGIGIMNVMLVSVFERTREIGLRKALGATTGVILTQFLVEAVVITCMGALVGIACGAVIAYLVSVVAGFLGYAWEFSIPLQSIAVSTGVAALIGLVFGVYPARRAARLDPIEALRYE